MRTREDLCDCQGVKEDYAQQRSSCSGSGVQDLDSRISGIAMPSFAAALFTVVSSIGTNFAIQSAHAWSDIPLTYFQLAIAGQHNRLVNSLEVHFGVKCNCLCVEESSSIATHADQNLPGAAINNTGKRYT